MPIYEYRCSDCGKVSEIFFKTLSLENVNCLHCGSDSLQKIFSVPAAVRTAGTSSTGATCCGRSERCETPPCSMGDGCHRDRENI